MSAPAGEPEPGVERRLRILQLICGALVAGIFLFGAVAVVLVATGAFAGAPDQVRGVPFYAFLALYLLLIGLAPIGQEKVARPPAGAGTEEVLDRYQQGVIVGFALREGPGLLGVVVGLLLASIPWIVALGGGAIFTMLRAWPRRARVEARLRAARGG